MCGIVGGIVKQGSIVPFLIEGLKALEYRGYDSAGLSVTIEGQAVRHRALGPVKELEQKIGDLTSIAAFVGIAHTRWATHGAPSEENAHPHVSHSDDFKVSVVHNGVIENHEKIRIHLQEQGYSFTSNTDTEVIAHLIHSYLTDGLTFIEAVRKVRKELSGLFAIAVTESVHHSDMLLALRQSAPLLLGISENGVLLASDASALIAQTNKMIYLENGDLVQILGNTLKIEDIHGNPAWRAPIESTLNAMDVSLGSYNHFMEKEIFEQPHILREAFDNKNTKELFERLLEKSMAEKLKSYSNILILACGTSAHAGLVAKHWFESIAEIPCSVELASEFYCRKPVLAANTVVLVISQSGETADTKAALEHAKQIGIADSFSICNVAESTLTRETTYPILTNAGPEIGVASTKAFTSQLASLYLLALAWRCAKYSLSPQSAMDDLVHAKKSIEKLPLLFGMTSQLQQWASVIASASSCLFLGRGPLYPIAMEGALKLKEISYIHAEAYSAGELKHGPLALVDETLPIIINVANDELLEKNKGEYSRGSSTEGACLCHRGQGLRI